MRDDTDQNGEFTSVTVAVLEYSDQVAGETLPTRPDAIHLTRYDMYDALWQVLAAPKKAAPGPAVPGKVPANR